jgi:hypothetical protein
MGTWLTRERLRSLRLPAGFAVAWVLDAFLYDVLSFLHVTPGMWGPLRLGYELTLRLATLIVVLSVVGRLLGARKGTWAIAARRFPTFVTRVLHWLPGAFWLYFAGYGSIRYALFHSGNADPSGVYHRLAGLSIGAVAMTLLARWAIRRAIAAAPTGPAPSEPVDPHETIFSAVAVTRVTIGLVGALAVLPLALIALLTQFKIPDPYLPAALAAYIATSFGTIVAMRAVSKIKVGIDGVYVMGSGPAKFHAWSRVDEVRADGGDIVLVRGGKVVLRLQLHGADAARRDALLERFHAARTAAAVAKNDTSHTFAAHAASAGGERLALSARGAVDYRKPAVQREQLWEVVEGAAADPSARVMAAEALAAQPESGDLARLRVAAEHCAEPKVRVALEQLLDDDDATEETAAEARPHALMPPSS